EFPKHPGSDPTRDRTQWCNETERSPTDSWRCPHGAGIGCRFSLPWFAAKSHVRQPDGVEVDDEANSSLLHVAGSPALVGPRGGGPHPGSCVDLGWHGCRDIGAEPRPALFRSDLPLA